MRVFVTVSNLAVLLCLAGTYSPVCADTTQTGAVTTEAPLSQAEQWVQKRSLPDFVLQDKEDKKKAKPIRSFVKHVAKGVASETAASFDGMAKDMVFVFSTQDIDPYEVKSGHAPKNRDAIVLKFTMVDGSSAYLRRFPDGSFAMEDGFADGTVVVRGPSPTEYVVKYPNGTRGRVVFQGRNTILVYRPDKTITTFKKTADGSYSITNDKLGYMGSARPDRTGVNYEIGNW
jgi:hypothetical protein